MVCMPETTPTANFQKHVELQWRKKTGKYKICREVHLWFCLGEHVCKNRGSPAGNRQAWQTEAFNKQMPLAKNLFQEEQAGFVER